MLRASIARLGLHVSGPSGVPGSAPDPVHAAAALADVTVPDGVTSAQVAVTLSYQVVGSDLVLTLTDGILCVIAVGTTYGLSEPYAISPGGDPFVVGIVSYEGGSFASLDISDVCTVTPGQAAELVRVYVNSIVHSSSGAFDKSDLLALVPGVDPALIEIDCEAVGGGAAGWYSKSSEGRGGAPGAVAVATRTYAEMPDTIEVEIGAGGAGSSRGVGGTTRVLSVVTAAGGDTYQVTPKDRPTGPGAGASHYGIDGEAARGGNSNDSLPELRLLGPSGGARRNGVSVATPFQHGTAGSSFVQTGGNGGWPGGGGGHGGGSGYNGGNGGAGAARFHLYVLEASE